MLISIWTLHVTYSTKAMTKSREGMEVRLSGPASLNDILTLHGHQAYRPTAAALARVAAEKAAADAAAAAA